MAETLASDLFIPEVAAQYARQAFVENMDVMSLIGGPGSGAPIELVNDPVFSSEGQYLSMPVFKRISSLGTRRDLTSVSAVTDLELTSGDEKAVKVHKKLGSVVHSLDAGRLSRASSEQISAEIGMQFGESAFLMLRETILNAARGAIAAMTTTAHTHDVWSATVRTNLSRTLINALKAKFGDSREKVKAVICRSESMQDLVDEYLGAGVTGIADEATRAGIILSSLGVSLTMCDSAALTTADGGFNKAHALILGPGAIKVGYSLPLTVYPPFLDTSKEQVLLRARGDVDYWVGIKGMGYNSGAGGANPTDAALLSAANWSVVYSDHREVLLGELVHNASAFA